MFLLGNSEVETSYAAVIVDSEMLAMVLDHSA